MEGCPGCSSSQLGQDIAYENALKAADELSKKDKIPVAVYKEGGEWKLENAHSAYKRGIGPIVKQVVSKHSGPATE